MAKKNRRDDIPSKRSTLLEPEPDYAAVSKTWLAHGWHAMLALAALCFFGILLISPVKDTDIWWHLREGQTFLQQGWVGQADLFTYTGRGFYWVNHAWLTDIVFSLLWEWKQDVGLILFRFVSFMFLATAMLWHYRKQRVPLGLAAVFLMIVLYIIQGRFLIRPHIISYVYNVTYSFLLIYGTGKTGNHRLLFYLVPLQLLWTNSHASFILGLAMQGCLLAGDMVQRFFADDMPEFNSAGVTWREIGLRCIIFITSLSVTLINPFFHEAYYMLAEQENKKLIQENTTEWFSPFHQFFAGTDFFFYFAIWLSIVTVLYVLNIGKLRLGFVFMAGFLFFLTLNSHRFRVDFTIYTFGTLAVVIRQLMESTWVRNLRRNVFENQLMWDTAVHATRAGLLILFVLIARARYAQLQPEFGISNSLPKRLVPFMEKWDISGRMWNDLMFGGWLVWFSKEPVYIDGRNFSYEVYLDYLDMQRTSEGFSRFMEKYEVDYLISRWPLTENDGIINVNLNALRSGQWVLVYFDEIVLIYVRNDEKYRRVIEALGQSVVHPFLFSADRLRDESQARLALQDLQKQLSEYPENPHARRIYQQVRARFPQLF